MQTNQNRTVLLGCVSLIALLAMRSLCGQETKTKTDGASIAKLNWQNEGIKSLRWGMSKDDLESALSERLRPEGGSGGVATFSSKLSTTWGGQRIVMGTSGGYGAFDLAKGRLFKITLTAADGWEEGLLKALFARLGDARHVRGILYRDGNGELVTRPAARTGEESHTYQWMDNDTEVLASEGYSYNSNTRKNERVLSVVLKGWKVAAQNATEEYSPNMTTFSERQIEMDAQEYFDWVKSHDKKPEQTVPKEKSKDSSI